jgi:hypothetical protein
MIGQIFGRLTVLTRGTSDKNGNSRWVCQCECGKETTVLGWALRKGRTKSCGCYGEEYRNTLMRKADEERRNYTKKSWTAMIGRCTNPKYPNYDRYGGKGIAVCDRWRFGESDKTGWICFFEDMGPKPTGCSIDRINNDKGYFLENCRWATRQEQLANRAKKYQPRKKST